jgi:DNA polymerase-1
VGFAVTKKKTAKPPVPTQEQCRAEGCLACPLSNGKGMQSPKMLPTGSKQPVILMLGDMPTKRDDELGELFSGKAGGLLQERIPEGWEGSIRWSSAVNCKPPDNRLAEPVEWQCCYPRLERDVLKYKPEAIFGFGYVPLMQIVQPDSKKSNIALWRGRRVAVDIGGHPCWYYPMLHPKEILYKRKFTPSSMDSYGCEEEFAFVLDLQRAFDEMHRKDVPKIHTIEQATANIEIVESVDRIAELLEAVSNDPSVGYDIETNAVRPYNVGAKILTFAFSGKEHTFAFAYEHKQNHWSDLERRQIHKLVKKFLAEARCRKFVHSLPFEQEWSGWLFGTSMFYSSRWEDTLSQAYILDARQGGLSLDFLCLQEFGIHLKDISGLDRANLDDEPVNDVLKYNAIDARYHRLLGLRLQSKIKAQNLQEVYEHQLRRIPSLVLSQMHGVPVDQSVVAKLKKKYTERVEKAAEAIAQEPIVQDYVKRKKKEFNPGSPIALLNLFRDNGVKVETTAKGELANIQHPLAKKIVQWREPMKVLSTYIEGLDVTTEDHHIYSDGMLHPNISTTRVISWRTASNGPNIQNFPKRDEELKEIRSQIRSPDPDMMVVSFDYAGIQARNVAMESKDKKLIEAYWNNYDIHADWRERIVKKCPKWIPKSKVQDKDALKHYRYLAKNQFVFPTFFGAAAWSMAESLGIPERDCENLREEFFDEFSGIKKWHQRLTKLYYSQGYVTGLSGFICRAPIMANQRINLPIQGDESIIVMDAMARLSELEDPRYQPMLMVHDDLTFLWPKKEIEKRAEVVVKTLINVPFDWANIVPIEVEMSVGPDWIDMKEVGKFSNDKWNGIVQLAK